MENRLRRNESVKVISWLLNPNLRMQAAPSSWLIYRSPAARAMHESQANRTSTEARSSEGSTFWAWRSHNTAGPRLRKLTLSPDTVGSQDDCVVVVTLLSGRQTRPGKDPCHISAPISRLGLTKRASFSVLSTVVKSAKKGRLLYPLPIRSQSWILKSWRSEGLSTSCW